MSKNKPGVPKSKPAAKKKHKPIKYDITEMVTRYLAVLNLEEITKQKKFKEEYMFFNGLKQGYIDWFGALKITQEQFDNVQQTVKKEDVLEYVEKMYGNVMSRRQKSERRIILPGEGKVNEAIEEIDRAWMRRFHEE